MPRKRKNPELAWLPPRVYIGKAAYEFRPRDGSCIALCPLNSARSVVISRYEQENHKLDQSPSFSGIINQFYNSAEFIQLRPKTQQDYQLYRKALTAVFGNMQPNNIEPKHVRQFMDKLGVRSITQANRHKACLQKICSWAYERGKIKRNPCQGVRKFTEKARDRYITDIEYRAIYYAAVPTCQIAMELAYNCMARIDDIINLKRSDITDQGIYIAQGKTGKKQIKGWTPRLEQAIAKAKSQQTHGVASIWVIQKPNGSKYTKRAIQAQYTNAKKIAAQQLGYSTTQELNVTFHDLKAKGISDFHGSISEKQHAAGHTNAKQTASYNRKIEVVPSLNKPVSLDK